MAKRKASAKGNIAPVHREEKPRGFSADEKGAIYKDLRETSLLMVEVEKDYSRASELGHPWWRISLVLDEENVSIIGVTPADLLRKLADAVEGIQ